jgi:zinc transporter ZupT
MCSYEGATGAIARLTLLLGLSLHSVMEGLGVGANKTQLWGAVIAILAHKVCTVCLVIVFR